MMHAIRPLVLIGACLLPTACSLPRSAGFEREVLAATGTTEDGTAVYDFDVYEVTRAQLPVIARWPSVGQGGHRWIRAEDRAAALLIAPGDRLAVSVWDAEDNSLLTAPGQRMAQLQETEVGADGRIFVPFVGDVMVGGLSSARARARIEEALVAAVPSAQVQLRLAPGRANTANLVSGVNQPGIYPLPDRNTSVLELIAEGGGVRSGLVNPQVRLFRGGRAYGISVDRLFADPAADAVVTGGDRVIVEEDQRVFLSLGATNRQAQHRFPTDRVSALDALAIMGGVSDQRANPQGILVLRSYPDSALGDGVSGPRQNRVVFTLDLTTADGLFSAGQFQISDGDLVYATESPLGSARSLVGLIGASVSVANNL